MRFNETKPRPLEKNIDSCHDDLRTTSCVVSCVYSCALQSLRYPVYEVMRMNFLVLNTLFPLLSPPIFGAQSPEKTFQEICVQGDDC